MSSSSYRDRSTTKQSVHTSAKRYKMPMKNINPMVKSTPGRPVNANQKFTTTNPSQLKRNQLFRRYFITGTPSLIAPKTNFNDHGIDMSAVYAEYCVEEMSSVVTK
jgi:hypothetical protein